MIEFYKKIDPLYILVFTILLFVLSIILFNNSKKELNSSQLELENVSKKGLDYYNLKNNWQNRNNTIKIIDNIIQVVKLKQIDKKILKKKIKIKFKSNSSKKIDKFINKILNQKLNILKLDINKNSVDLEVGLK
jgi:hypothetical protein